MFAKMITFLCVATNKDPPIEVSVTTNAGTGTCIYMYLSARLHIRDLSLVCTTGRITYMYMLYS